MTKLSTHNKDGFHSQGQLQSYALAKLGDTAACVDKSGTVTISLSSRPRPPWQQPKVPLTMDELHDQAAAEHRERGHTFGSNADTSLLDAAHELGIDLSGVGHDG